MIIDDVRRHCRFSAMYIDEYIGRSVPDDELAEYLLDLVGQNLKACESRLENLLDQRFKNGEVK
jgi:hypothetical protein